MSDKNNFTEEAIRSYWAGTDIWKNKFDSAKEFLEPKTCFACSFCNGDTKKVHIISLKKGGKNVVKNIHLLCKECHLASKSLSQKAYWKWFYKHDITNAACNKISNGDTTLLQLLKNEVKNSLSLK